MFATMIQEIKEWQDSIIQTPSECHGINLHIDEVSKNYLKRETWIKSTFDMFNHVLETNTHQHQIIPFFHIELTLTETDTIPPVITFDYLNSDVSLYTPPSIMYATAEYYKEYYLTLKTSDIQPISKNLLAHYATSFEEIESLYRRDLYIFPEEYINL